VKLHNPDRQCCSLTRAGAERLSVVGLTVKSLAAVAFGVREFQITGGPSWVSDDRFDVDAKAESISDLAGDRFPLLVRNLLQDYFGVKTHTEKKEGPVYELSISKTGVKLHATAAAPEPPLGSADPGPQPAGTPGRLQSNRGRIAGVAVPFGTFVKALSLGLDRPLIDKTGLTGSFDIRLEWTPDLNPGDAVTGDASGPSLFTAIQEQLGLKLESAKGQVEMVVIDSAQKPAQDASVVKAPAPNRISEASPAKTARVVPAERRLFGDEFRAPVWPTQLASIVSLLPSVLTESPATQFAAGSAASEAPSMASVDMFSGVWVLDLDASNKANEESGARTNSGRGFTRPNTEEIRANDEAITVIHDGVLDTGQKRHIEYTVKFDGKEYLSVTTLDGLPDPNVMPLKYSARKVDDYTIALTIQPTNEQNRGGVWVLPPPAAETMTVSRDGQTRTVKQQAPGRPGPFFMFWKRQ
jgi:uncharacterized protein (TIGR03435 family)